VRFGMCGVRFGVWGLEFKMKGFGFEVWFLEQGSELRGHGSGFRVQGAGRRMLQDVGFAIRVFGLRVWGGN